MREEVPRNGATRAKQAEVQRAADESEPRLLQLQRSSGNVAVTQMIQRDKTKQAKPKLVKARIIGVQVKDKQTYITIAMGTSRGVTEGMKGWLLRADGTHLVSFTIDQASGGSSYAYVEASVDEVEHGNASVELDLGTAQPDWRKLGD